MVPGTRRALQNSGSHEFRGSILGESSPSGHIHRLPGESNDLRLCRGSFNSLAKLIEVLNRAKKSAKGRIDLFLDPRITDDLVAPHYLNTDFSFVQKCDHFRRTLPVQPNGRVTSYVNFVAGNTAEHSVTEIRNGEMMQSFRGMFANKLVPGCTRYPLRHYVRDSRCIV